MRALSLSFLRNQLGPALTVSRTTVDDVATAAGAAGAATAGGVAAAT